ncbi:uncharacterized protein LOC130717952 [Lotus japonicus]|uniref:uncharacterized protein LOC130717952 n=1 Tax=Lotus japonicus TaxID=34305 RepID=UPI002590E2F2|nr:uncharacterized protein LOC130717952 [Lotus japonicus]
MGFNSVFKSLLEIFPQVDARLLRAVAIEHPKDADVAAEIVLTEVIPSMSVKSPPVNPPQDNSPVVMNMEVESKEEGNLLVHDQLFKDADVETPSSSSHLISEEITKTADVGTLGLDLNVALDESTLSSSSNISDDTDKFLGMSEIEDLNISQRDHRAVDNFTEGISDNIAQETSDGFRQEASENFDQEPLDVNDDGAKLISSGICQEMETEQNYVSEEAASTSNNGNRNAHNLNEEWVDFEAPSVDDCDATVCVTSHRLEKGETDLIEVIEVEGSEAEPVQRHAPNAADSLQLELNACPSSTVGETNNVEDNIEGNIAHSQHIQACRIDLLEQTIDDAKTNKKTLFSSMESLINLMREVELQEKAAEQANMEAATGGSNILVRVEEYKTMLLHAKEANDMHAGEIYGEKAILATELKELQSRLTTLSGERDKSLAILEEMRQSLEARLAAAEILRKAAEREMLEKEESARKALAEQEAMMEKVVQESARLQHEAEENSKLQEFLMDRGRVVDVLQGEISVICQDVRLLKEKFDANLPLSKSFTSSQTSCKLASSGSSHRTVASDVGSEQSDSSELLKITSPAASIKSLSSKSGNEERPIADHNALLDDGWDICEEDGELLNSGVW